MKKLVSCMILLFCFLSGGTVAYAAVGDVIGNIYATDIVTYLNGMKIPSYNIGGKTVIVVEDLERYGFQVEWNEEGRYLTVYSNRMPEAVPEYIPPKKSSPGKMIGNIYETDIKVSINDESIEKKHIYNIGGRTVIEVSAISEFDPDEEHYGTFGRSGYSRYGFHFVWHPEERIVEIEAIMGGKEVQTDFGTFLLNSIMFAGPYVTNYTNSKEAYESRNTGSHSSNFSDFERNNIFYFNHDDQYGDNKYMNLKSLLEMADITIKEQKENMLVLEKGAKQSLHTYEDAYTISTHPQYRMLGSVTLKSSNCPEKNFSVFVSGGEIYMEEKDIAEFIGMPFSYTYLDIWFDGKDTKLIDKVVTP